MMALCKALRLLAVLLAVALAPGIATAQETAAEKEPFVFKPPTQPVADPATAAASESPEKPTLTGVLPMEATPAMLRELAEHAYAHQAWVFSHQQRVFESQYKTTWISFFLVITITLSGLIFSAMQFVAAQRSSSDLSGAMMSELEFSGKGLKVSSPVLGVVILTISIGFFYLFVRHIYPIEAVRTIPESAGIERVASP